MNAVRGLTVASAGLVVSALSAGSAQTATISGSFTNLQGQNVSWSAMVIRMTLFLATVLLYVPGNQGDGTINNLVNSLWRLVYWERDKLDNFSGFGVNWTGPSADIFALHFGGPHGGNEVLFAVREIRAFSISGMSGTQFALSSLQGFGPSESVSQIHFPQRFLCSPAALEAREL